METFVIHIHRRTGSGASPGTDASAGGGDVLAGIVERTDSTVSRRFATLDELLALLGVQHFVAPQPRQSSRSKS